MTISTRLSSRSSYLKSNGFSTVAPAARKSSTSRVATVRRCSKAVAAMRLSLIGIARPFFFRRASNRAQEAAVAASKSRTCIRETPARNHSSSRVRRRLAGMIKIPYSNSPRTMGLSASSCSYSRSQARTDEPGAGLVGSLRMLASTRYFTKSLSILRVAGRTSFFPDRPGANRPALR
jgi:hypothetical protein